MLNIVPNTRGIPNFIEKTGDSLFLGDHITGDLLFWKNVDMTNMITGWKTNTHKFRLHTVKIRGCSSIIPSKQTKMAEFQTMAPGVRWTDGPSTKRTNRKKHPLLRTLLLEREERSRNYSSYGSQLYLEEIY